MAATFLSLIVLQLLFVGCVISASVKQIGRSSTGKLALEGQKCRTNEISEGVCTKEEDCDQVFFYSLRYEDHTHVCRHKAKYKVICCKSFMDYCEHRKHPHIYGGEDAPPGSFPHLARIGNYKRNDIQWECGSNIISDQFLLTAAHCLPARVAGLGCSNATHCDQLIRVKVFVSYSGYKNGTKYNDIALVQLEHVMKFNRNVLPICPYHSAEDLPEDFNLTVAGWGATETELSGSTTLRFTQLHTVPLAECQNSLSPFVNMFKKSLPNGITNGIYCARGSYSEQHGTHGDACQGDSGGPLQIGSWEQRLEDKGPPYLVGVVSTGFGCGRAEAGIYTRVGAYIDWIKKTIQDLI